MKRILAIAAAGLLAACTGNTGSSSSSSGGTGGGSTGGGSSGGSTGSHGGSIGTSGSSGGTSGGGTNGGLEGTGTVTGPLGFPVANSLEFTDTYPDGGQLLDYVGFANIEVAMTCAQVQDAGSSSLTHLAVGLVQGPRAITAGTYNIWDPNGTTFPNPDAGFALVQVGQNFPDGGNDARAAASGTLTYTTVTPSRLVGSFDVQVRDDAGALVPVSGTFDAAYCPQ